MCAKVFARVRERAREGGFGGKVGGFGVFSESARARSPLAASGEGTKGNADSRYAIYISRIFYILYVLRILYIYII